MVATPQHKCESGGCSWKDALWQARGHRECAADLRRLVEEGALVKLLAVAAEELDVPPERLVALFAEVFGDLSDDVAAALGILADLEPDEFARWRWLHELMLRARELVRQPRVREAIELVVGALHREPNLKGKQLEAVIARVDEMLKTKEK